MTDLLLTPLFLAALASTDAAALRETVRCTEVAFSRSAERNDPAAFRAFLDPDTRFGSGERIRRGPDAVVEGWMPLLTEGGPAITWRPDTVEVRADGIALSRGPYRTITTEEDGSTTERWGHFNSVWRFDAGSDRWLIIFDVGGDHGMTPTDAERALIEEDPGCEEKDGAVANEVDGVTGATWE